VYICSIYYAVCKPSHALDRRQCCWVIWWEKCCQNSKLWWLSTRGLIFHNLQRLCIFLRDENKLISNSGMAHLQSFLYSTTSLFYHLLFYSLSLAWAFLFLLGLLSVFLSLKKRILFLPTQFCPSRFLSSMFVSSRNDLPPPTQSLWFHLHQ